MGIKEGKLARLQQILNQKPCQWFLAGVVGSALDVETVGWQLTLCTVAPSLWSDESCQQCIFQSCNLEGMQNANSCSQVWG